MATIHAEPFAFPFAKASIGLVVIDVQRDFIEPGGFGETLGNDAPVAGETVIDKPGKGAFYATDFGAHLQAKGLRRLVFAGVTTEVCVQTTMREANDRGYDCLLAEDATESYFPAFKQAALEMICAQGAIVGWTATTDQVLEGLLDA